MLFVFRHFTRINMKSPEHWASLYFSDKVRNLPDLIKEVQEEAKAEVISKINKTIEEFKSENI